MSLCWTKQTKCVVHPAKTQIRLGVAQFDQSLSCLHEEGMSLDTHGACTKDNDRTGHSLRFILGSGHFVSLTMR